MATAGWQQQNDTGQVVWPLTIINITQITYSAGTNTITFTINAGASPIVAGQSIRIAGATNAGNNGTYIVVTTNGTTSMTVADANPGVTETPTALTCWGSVDTYAAPFTTLSVTSSVITFNFSTLYGTLRIGQSIVVVGTSGGTYDGTYTITGGNLTTNFTAATAAGNVGSTACASATGTVHCNYAVINTAESTTTTLPPATSSSVYEIWKMNDGNTLPIYLRINYGTGSTATYPVLTFVLQAATDGAGGIPAATGNTGAAVGFIGNSTTASAFTSYMSGSTNRLQLAMFPGNTATTASCIVNIERSHDSSGVDTTSGQYATFTVVGHIAGGVSNSQVSITAANQTVAETKLPCILNHTTATGTFVLSTLLSPVFPVVGAVGNPMIGLLVGKSVDWTDTAQFSFYMYNISHAYIVFNSAAMNAPWSAANTIIYDTTPTACPIMRFE